ncbi:unnamed protein product [Polarella glacialis]|uniref:Uncharacterized protein n=1 Tax=Polarella glacialis TaxID=89957 RepID=A0A813D661_POLGL|nr:unnamed protein product [Polarella glacialis]
MSCSQCSSDTTSLTESLQGNVQRLRLHLSKLLLFPKKSGKRGVKKGDTPVSELQNVAQNTLREIIPMPKPELRIKARAIPKVETEKSAHKTLEMACTDQKYLGAKLKQAKAASGKAEE